MRDEIHVKGLAQLGDFLKQLPEELRVKVLRAALREAAKPVAAEVKGQLERNQSVQTGQLRDGIKIATRSRRGFLTARVRATGPHAHIAYWLEFTGAAPHVIAPKKKGGKTAVFFLGKARMKVDHPGFKPKPFMRPALETRAQEAVLAAGNYIKQRLASRKFGFDTSDIDVDGDEK